MSIRKISRLLTIAMTFVFTIGSNVSGQTPSAEEVIRKHLDSIATTEKRSAIANLYVLGEAEFKFVGSPNILSGKGLILSDKNRSSWALSFLSNDYPMDRFVYDGKRVTVQRTNTEGRSFLAQFVYDNRKLLENGVLGGTLSNSWILLDNRAGARFEVGNGKKIAGKETISLEYRPKGGSEVSTKFYFNKDNFQHVRTEHVVSWSAKQGATVDDSSSQNPTTVRLTEDFSDFRKMGELTLPSTYRLSYVQTGSLSLKGPSNVSKEAEWVIRLTSFGVNQQLDENSFTLTN